MALYNCRDQNKNVLSSWEETILEKDILRCTQIVLERRNLDTVKSAKRKAGDSIVLEGNWKEGTRKLLETLETAPELVPEVKIEPFPDRNSHTFIHNSWIQRADFISGIIETLDVDDQNKYNNKLFRDISGALRALCGDVLDLQERLGEAMMRIDNLEQWNKTGDINTHNLPGSTINENLSMTGLPPLPYFIGSELISNDTEQQLYHQGHHVRSSDGGLRRYYSAQESRGIPSPVISPRAIADENTKRNERFDQGTVAGDGGPVCSKGTSRQGYGPSATCVENPNGFLQEFPPTAVETIPVYTTPIYKPKIIATGLCVLPSVLQRVLGGLETGYLSADDDEVYFNVKNPVCVPNDGNLKSLPKCLKPSEQPNAFLPMPPFPLVTNPCLDGDAELLPFTCPEEGA